jgi:hypothetical protein
MCIQKYCIHTTVYIERLHAILDANRILYTYTILHAYIIVYTHCHGARLSKFQYINILCTYIIVHAHCHGARLPTRAFEEFETGKQFRV